MGFYLKISFFISCFLLVWLYCRLFFFFYTAYRMKSTGVVTCFIQLKPSLTSECKHSLLRVIITPVHITSTMSGIKNAIADRQVGVY